MGIYKTYSTELVFLLLAHGWKITSVKMCHEIDRPEFTLEEKYNEEYKI